MVVRRLSARLAILCLRLGVSLPVPVLSSCVLFLALLRGLAAVVAHVWIVVALINAELLKQVVFEAVRPRGAFGLVRASVVRSDCV